MSMVTGFSSLNVSVAPPLHIIHEKGEAPSTQVENGNHEEARASSKEPLQITKKADSAVFTIGSLDVVSPLARDYTLIKIEDAFVAIWQENLTPTSRYLYARHIDTTGRLGSTTTLSIIPVKSCISAIGGATRSY